MEWWSIGVLGLEERLVSLCAYYSITSVLYHSNSRRKGGFVVRPLSVLQAGLRCR